MMRRVEIKAGVNKVEDEEEEDKEKEDEEKGKDDGGKAKKQMDTEDGIEWRRKKKKDV